MGVQQAFWSRVLGLPSIGCIELFCFWRHEPDERAIRVDPAIVLEILLDVAPLGMAILATLNVFLLDALEAPYALDDGVRGMCAITLDPA